MFDFESRFEVAWGLGWKQGHTANEHKDLLSDGNGLNCIMMIVAQFYKLTKNH